MSRAVPLPISAAVAQPQLSSFVNRGYEGVDALPQKHYNLGDYPTRHNGWWVGFH